MPLDFRKLWCGTRGRTRTGTAKGPEILSLLCLPFHHAGTCEFRRTFAFSNPFVNKANSKSANIFIVLIHAFIVAIAKLQAYHLTKVRPANAHAI